MSTPKPPKKRRGVPVLEFIQNPALIGLENRGRPKTNPANPKRKYETVEIKRTRDKTPSTIDKNTALQYMKAIKCKTVRVTPPRRTAFRMVEIRGVFWRVVSTSGSKNHPGNWFKVYRNGDPVVVVPTTMRDPLGYIRKWPTSKWRQILIDEIRNVGLSQQDAEKVIDAPLVFI